MLLGFIEEEILLIDGVMEYSTAWGVRQGVLDGFEEEDDGEAKEEAGEGVDGRHDVENNSIEDVSVTEVGMQVLGGEGRPGRQGRKRVKRRRKKGKQVEEDDEAERRKWGEYEEE